MSKSKAIPNSRELYFKLLSYAFKYKAFFIIGVIGFTVFSAAESMLIMTVEFFFDALEGKSSSRLSFLPQEITSAIAFVPITVITIAVIRGVGSFLGNYYITRVGINVVNDLRKQVFTHIIGLPQAYFDKHNTSELVALIIFNIEQVTRSVTESVKIIFRDGLLVIFLLGLLLYYNWKLTLVFFAVSPVLAGLIYLASRYFLRVSRKIQKAVAMITHVATESFQGIKLVKSYRGEQHEVQRFKTAADDNLKYATKFERVKAIQTPTLHVIVASALAVIMLLILLFWNGTPAAAIAYVTAAGAIAKPFRSLTNLNSTIQKGIAASETIFGTLDIAAEENHGKVKLEDVKGRIEFQYANFSYSPHEKAIQDLNLIIEPGETLAIVGKSGSGKSTLTNLLLRFYDLDSGDIRIDNTSIKDIELGNLRQNIALVNQKAILFSDTIQSNIAYGSDLNQHSEQDILQAATDAYAIKFIQELEDGFSAEAGEGGSRLSGGQQQRITIARALLKDAPILILDEATSALDNESETKIQAALEQLKQGRTTIVIAHRLSTIENADKIAVMEKGKIIEYGTHHSLLALNGQYAALHSNNASETPPNREV